MAKETVDRIIKIEMEAQNRPDFKPVKNKDYIAYGSNNDYPNYLIDLYNRCAEHHSIITGKANYIFGKGLGYEPVNDVKVDAQVEKFLGRANPFESWNDLLKKICLNFELIDGFYLQHIFGKNGKIVSTYLIDSAKIRRSSVGTDLIYCENWLDAKEREKAKHYPEYSPILKTGSCIRYVKIHQPSATVYGDTYSIPNYIGALSAIETDINIDLFFNTMSEHGMTAQGMLSLFNGIPTDDEQRNIKKVFERNYTGPKKAASFLLNFVEPGGKEALLTNFSASDLDKQFELLGKRVQNKIFIGHKVDPVLFGVDTATSWNRPQMLEKWEKFNISYVEQRQDFILNVIKEIADNNGVNGSSLIIETLPPIGEEFELSENIFTSVLTIEEQRNYLRDKKGVELSSFDDESATSRLSLAQKLGAGSSSTLQQLVLDQNIKPEQKLGMLSIMYSIPEKRARKMLGLPEFDVPNASPVKDNVQSLASQIGVGGVTALATILADPTTTPEQKSNMAQIIFGVDKSSADRLAGVANQIAPTAMSAVKDEVSLAFKARARKSNGDEILEEKFISFDSSGKVCEYEIKQKQKFAEVLGGTVQEVRKQILDLIAGDPFIKAELIAKQLGTDVEYVTEQITQMTTQGIISSIGSGYNLTDKGLGKAEGVEPVVETEIYTVYKYSLSPNADYSNKLGYIETSHEFCKDRMDESNSGDEFTREDIDSISNEFDMNAWVYRGGFTGHKNAEPTAYCNHVWKAITKVRKRGKNG